MHVILEAPVIEHFPAMPYAPKYRAFRAHMTDCQQCAEAHAAQLDCDGYCPEGHGLIHAINLRMAATASASRWN